MEVQRTVGQDIQYLINLFLTERPVTVAQLMNHLGEGENLFSPRSLRRVLLIVAQLLDELGNTFEPLDAIYLLRRQKEWMIHRQFFDGIDQVIDGTTCDLIQPAYEVPAGGRISCRRETARCNLVPLLQPHTESLQLLKDNAAALALLGRQTERAITEISRNLDVAKGERNCWSIGDLILVLECPPDAALWTTNLRHFEPLCKHFGRQMFHTDVLSK